MARVRTPALLLALAATFMLVTADMGLARVGSGSSAGSRGSRTYSTPPSTTTAPRPAPIEKSITPKAGPAVTPGAQSSGFGSWRGLLMGGLFAAALGSIFGFGALASALGCLLQVALIAGLGYLAFAFFRNRNAVARSVGTSNAGQTYARQSQPAQSASPSFGAAQARSAPASQITPMTVADGDLDTFESLLGKIQTAYAREDTRALGSVTTPEMFAHFSQELADNARNGVLNEVSNIKLLQGDVSEAWREGGTEYATVAMRYSLIDATVERGTGRVVAGDRTRPSEVVELWTFRRDDRARNEGWQLSAIQQAA